MAESKSIVDANGKEIQVGNRVRFATWGMFDVVPRNDTRKDTDPAYVTHTMIGTVEELLDEEDGTLHIRPDGSKGVIHLCTKPSWRARPEFVEVIHG